MGQARGQGRPDGIVKRVHSVSVRERLDLRYPALAAKLPETVRWQGV